jgi:hypothetical protein
MFAIYSSCKAILPTLEPPRPHASKDPIRLKVIGVALAIHSFWLLFRGFDSETNRSVNGCYEDSLINRRVASSRMALPYWRGLLERAATRVSRQVTGTAGPRAGSQRFFILAR